MAAQKPQTRLVYLSDGAADIVAMMRLARELNTLVDWLVRAKHNRFLPYGEKLWSYTTKGAALGEIAFTVLARSTQKARPVRQQLRIRAVEISDGKRGVINATCIIAREICAPPKTSNLSNGAC